jgi:hypothetical protein
MMENIFPIEYCGIQKAAIVSGLAGKPLENLTDTRSQK